MLSVRVSIYKEESSIRFSASVGAADDSCNRVMNDGDRGLINGQGMLEYDPPHQNKLEGVCSYNRNDMGLRGVVLMAHPPSIASVFVTGVGRAFDFSPLYPKRCACFQSRPRIIVE